MFSWRAMLIKAVDKCAALIIGESKPFAIQHGLYVLELVMIVFNGKNDPCGFAEIGSICKPNRYDGWWFFIHQQLVAAEIPEACGSPVALPFYFLNILLCLRMSIASGSSVVRAGVSTRLG